MRKLVSVLFAGAVLASLLPAGPAAAADNSCWTYKRPEKGFNRKMNAARTNAGLAKLSLDPELSKAARVHTREMVKRNELYHTPSNRLASRVTNWIILGENVGVGSTVSSLHQAFMDSPAHRDNIMKVSFKHVGIGVLKKHGRMWVTVIFEAVTDPGTTLSMPKC